MTTSLFILRRIESTPEFTIGDLTIGGRHICWTCEDPEREIPGQPVEEWKINGKTAIPRGTYMILRTWSQRFNQTMPQLMDVPGFEGIRIHPGNTSEDTEGCILPGFVRLHNGVGESRLAYTEILRWLDAIERQDFDASIKIIGPDDAVTT